MAVSVAVCEIFSVKEWCELVYDTIPYHMSYQKDTTKNWHINFCRAAHDASYGVRPSVTFVNSVKTNKHIFKIASPFLFFCTKRHSNISTGSPLMGTSNAGGVGTNAILDESLSIDDCCSCVNNNCDSGRCNLPHRTPHISDSIFITASMIDHDEEKKKWSRFSFGLSDSRFAETKLRTESLSDRWIQS